MPKKLEVVEITAASRHTTSTCRLFVAVLDATMHNPQGAKRLKLTSLSQIEELTVVYATLGYIVLSNSPLPQQFIWMCPFVHTKSHRFRTVPGS